MKKKDKLEELERRIRELENRPITYPPIYIGQPASPLQPQLCYWCGRPKELCFGHTIC